MFVPDSTGKAQARTGHQTCQPVHLAEIGVMHLEPFPTNCMAEAQKQLLAKVILCSTWLRKEPCITAVAIASALPCTQTSPSLLPPFLLIGHRQLLHAHTHVL